MAKKKLQAPTPDNFDPEKFYEVELIAVAEVGNSKLRPRFNPYTLKGRVVSTIFGKINPETVKEVTE
jgi:hypothetical protein